jgi:hypothetical protein
MFIFVFLYRLLFLSYCFGTSNQDIHRLENEARMADQMAVDHEELLKTNPGFRGLTRAGVPQKRGMLVRDLNIFIP